MLIAVSETKSLVFHQFLERDSALDHRLEPVQASSSLPCPPLPLHPHECLLERLGRPFSVTECKRNSVSFLSISFHHVFGGHDSPPHLKTSETQTVLSQPPSLGQGGDCFIHRQTGVQNPQNRSCHDLLTGGKEPMTPLCHSPRGCPECHSGLPIEDQSFESK